VRSSEIANFGDVLASNLPFLLVGIAGLWACGPAAPVRAK